jgi:hypothetical protein
VIAFFVFLFVIVQNRSLSVSTDADLRAQIQQLQTFQHMQNGEITALQAQLLNNGIIPKTATTTK